MCVRSEITRRQIFRVRALAQNQFLIATFSKNKYQRTKSISVGQNCNKEMQQGNATRKWELCGRCGCMSEMKTRNKYVIVQQQLLCASLKLFDVLKLVSEIVYGSCEASFSWLRRDLFN